MNVIPGFDPGFSTPEMTTTFSLSARVSGMLAVESALAVVSAELGIIPRAAAESIVTACTEADIDAFQLAEAGWEVGTPVVPMLDAIRSALNDEDAAWLHFGATTQDIVDSASMLQMKDGLTHLAEDLTRSVECLAALAGAHRRTTMAGRSFLQPGEPITFGVVVAGWLTALDRHRRNLEAERSRLPVQLGGPVGDLKRFGAHAGDVVRLLASELDLSEPIMPWHADRAPVAETMSHLESTTRTIAKIAIDLSLLAQAGEIRVRSGGSSSMPHKANPVDAIRAIAASEACIGATSVVTRGRAHELQRGIGGWHAEWWAVPMSFHCAGAAMAALERGLASVQPDATRMHENLVSAGLDTTVPATTDLLIDRALEARTRP